MSPRSLGATFDVEPLVRARGLTRRYPVPKTGLFERTTYTTALDDADLDVRAGSAVGIIGESGSGKSTLVRLLLALDTPTAGTVEFDGTTGGCRGQGARRCIGCAARPASCSRTRTRRSILG